LTRDFRWRLVEHLAAGRAALRGLEVPVIARRGAP
jgi:hypothetical protein